MMHAVMQNHARALELLLSLRDPAHEDADLLFNLGVCERELGHVDAAARWFEVYTETLPDHSEGWAGLAECRLQQAQHRAAIALADRLHDSAGLEEPEAPARRGPADQIGSERSVTPHTFTPNMSAMGRRGTAYVS